MELTPWPCLRNWFASLHLLGPGVHTPAPLGVPCRVAGGYPPAMHEVVQRAKVEVYPDFVQDGLEPGIERRTVLRYHESGPDRAQALGRVVGPLGNEVLRLRAHDGLLCP